MLIPKRFAAAMDALWVTTFLASWTLFLAFWNTWWGLLFGTLSFLHLMGLGEFIHQAVHRNLFGRNPWLNRGFGRVAAALLTIDFDTYKDFHLGHHRFTNTNDDPERPLYKAPEYLAMVAGWKDMTPRQKLRQSGKILDYGAKALASFGGNLPFVRFVRWATPALIACTGYLEGLPWYMIPVKVLVVWVLPLAFFLPIDTMLAQSEHYETPDGEISATLGIVPANSQYALSWNLSVPRFVSYFLLNRNLHAEHHRAPGMHWTQARDPGEGRMMTVPQYLRLLWTQGPRA